MATPRPVAVDLFAGAGGLSLGFEQAGFDIGAALEKASGPASTHKLNFPLTPVMMRDIREVTASQVRKAISEGLEKRGLSWDGEVTVCAGGPPCQGYSVGGKHRLDDERNGLVHHFRRLVTKLGSRYFVMENVPGLMLPAYANSLNKLISAFKRAGYHVAKPFILDASRLGLPQSRRRVLIVGWLDGETAIDVGGLQKLDVPKISAHEALADLPDIELIESLRKTDTYRTTLSRRTRSAYAERMRELGVGLAKPRSWDGITLTGCARTEHLPAVVQRFRQTRPGDTEPISRYRRLSPSGIAPTLRAGTGPEHGSHTSPRPIHYQSPRVITVREAARLQSFPDWFQFAKAKWHAWQEIGNAVPPLMAQAIGKAVLRAAEVPTAETSDTTTRIR